MGVSIKDGEFIDDHGRVLNLRGVNLSGSSKIPSSGNSLDPSAVESTTFVNRPFPIEEASFHFARLRACGFTLIRFIVTWEAIEHAGPGIYDTEYLQYIRQILEKAAEYDLNIYIDPHQDVWSRWTGGDGAPLWTLETVGFDVSSFRYCEAAICEQTYGTGHSSAERKGGGVKKLPKMIWPTNYFKLACATMFTLFWAGERFAPQLMVDDGTGSKINIQTFLQTHFTNAMAELLKYLVGLDNIVGIGTMNEPSPGYINVKDLSRGFGQSGDTAASLSELKYGLAPTPFKGMCLGDGHKQTVGEWSNGFMQHVLQRSDKTVSVDPKGKRVWKAGQECIWKQAGVWRINPQTSQPELIHKNYFANVDFGKECYLPFAVKYTTAMREVWSSRKNSPLLLFVELPPLEFSSTPFPEISATQLPDAVNATHWYDGLTLFKRSWTSYFTFDTRTHRPVFGYNNVFKTHVSQLKEIKQLGVEKMNNSPSLIGECGIPYDMNDGKSFRSGNFGSQYNAMDHTLRCLEKNLLSFTLWCYTPDNDNEKGDLWNGEDLSIHSEDQKSGFDEKHPHFIYDGLRTASAVVRPYARCIAGKPLENQFNMQKGVFTYRGVKSCDITLPTEIFVPKLWCLTEEEMNIKTSGGRFEVEEHKNWFIVKYWPSDADIQHRVAILGPSAQKSQPKIAGLPF